MQKHSREEDLVTAAEVTSVYHGVKHHHSYSSQDCNNKLFRTIFPDSEVAKKIACGRTKATTICENVIAPLSQEILLSELQDSTYFSIGTDSSNKGNLKMFPVTVQWFSLKDGLKQGLLDFYQDPAETSEAIKTQLCKVLQENGLTWASVSSLSADNASVNYGIHNSVFQKLKNENENILKANCKCHILHNCNKYALKALQFDVESLVLKTYSEFSAFAKRTAKLKEFFDFTHLEYKSILRHVPTRWLSLLPALDRLILNWPALREYFLNEGEDECAAIIWMAFKDENCLPLCYCYFIHNIMQIFDTYIKKLESDYITCTELHTIMTELRTKITNRKNDMFYGHSARQCLMKLTESDQNTFKEDANKYLDRCLTYLNKWYEFDDSIYKKMNILTMDEEINWNELKELGDSLNVPINEDKLYDDYCLLREVREVVASKTKRVDLRWVHFFEKCKEESGKELKKLVTFILSIPVSNAAAERVFSVVNELWSKSRNRLSETHVKSEIQVCTNFNYTCKEFYDFIVCNQKALHAARSVKKYNFK